MLLFGRGGGSTSGTGSGCAADAACRTEAVRRRSVRQRRTGPQLLLCFFKCAPDLNFFQL